MISFTWRNTMTTGDKSQRHLNIVPFRHNSFLNTFKQHLNNTSAKVCTSNKIIQKLCGSIWESTTNTLRCSALRLVCSNAKSAAPVWVKVRHINKFDRTELHDAVHHGMYHSYSNILVTNTPS